MCKIYKIKKFVLRLFTAQKKFVRHVIIFASVLQTYANSLKIRTAFNAVATRNLFARPWPMSKSIQFVPRKSHRCHLTRAVQLYNVRVVIIRIINHPGRGDLPWISWTTLNRKPCTDHGSRYKYLMHKRSTLADPKCNFGVDKHAVDRIARRKFNGSSIEIRAATAEATLRLEPSLLDVENGRALTPHNFLDVSDRVENRFTHPIYRHCSFCLNAFTNYY